MKQAILITAYKNFDHLEKIIRFFEDESFEVYLHIDRKSNVTKSELINLKKYNSLKLLSRKYKVNWGGFNHLKSILYLMKKAFRNPNICYFHLISGHDYPIKKKSYFIDFFKNNTTEYIDCFEVPYYNWNGNGGMDRIDYFNFYDILNAKKIKQKKIILLIVKFQKKIGFKRNIDSRITKIYGGQTWWSLSRKCVDYIVNYTQKNKFLLKRFKYTFCSEEFYIQTVIMNSVFSSNVQSNCLRYIDWEERNGNCPANLDDSDYHKVMSSDAFFARKFETYISLGLLNSILKFKS